MVGDFKHEALVLKSGIICAPFGLPMHWNYARKGERAWDLPSHWHEQLEISFTIHGEIEEFNVNGQSYKTKDNDILVILPGDIHNIKRPYDNRSPEVLTIFFDPLFLVDLVPEVKSMEFDVHPNAKDPVAAKKLAETLLRMRDYVVKNEEGIDDKLELTHLIYDIVFQLINSFSRKGDGQEISLEGSDAAIQLMKQVVNYIKENIQEDIGVDDVARNFNISSSYLTRMFKRYIDKTPMAYIKMIRVRLAAQYLLNTEYSIQYVSDLAGFSNLRNFERLFKQRYGKTPSQYRQKLILEQKNKH